MPNLTDPKIFQNITKPIKYRASYAKKDFTVTWKDWDNSALKIETVGMHMSASPPRDPVRTGYKFSGWNTKNYTTILNDLAITAQYTLIPVETFTVKWLNWDDSVLKTETVKKGEDATPPDDPTRTDYRFTGWDTSYINISADINIKAVFVPESSSGSGSETTPGKFKITFVKRFFVSGFEYTEPDIYTTLSEIEIDSGKVPSYSAPKYDGECFVRWDQTFVAATCDITYVAYYISDEAPTLYHASPEGEFSELDLMTPLIRIVHASSKSESYDPYDSKLVHLGFKIGKCKINLYGPGKIGDLVTCLGTGVSSSSTNLTTNPYAGFVVFSASGTYTYTVKNKLSGKSRTVSINIAQPDIMYEEEEHNDSGGSWLATAYVEGNVSPSIKAGVIFNSPNVGELVPFKYIDKTATGYGTSSNKDIFMNCTLDAYWGHFYFLNYSSGRGIATLTTYYNTTYLKTSKSWYVSR